MPFIGNQPALSYTSFAVQHFTTSATTSYTLDHSVANENEIRLVINNVVQQPGSSYAYTASGTTLTLSAATSATDTMYAVFLGKAVQTVTPANNTITNAMLGETITVANGGTGLTSGFKNGITEADMYRLTADLTADANPITANLERVDDASFSKIGTGVTKSSGVFTFPSTGIYFVQFQGCASGTSDNDNVFLDIKGTTDNSSYDVLARGIGGIFESNSVSSSFTCQSFFDVTDTTTHKIHFRLHSLSSGNQLRGDTSQNETTFTFIRLGDT